MPQAERYISINGIFCGSPMFADDLALVSESDSDLQSMLNIVTHYANTWRYKLNVSKSSMYPGHQRIQKVPLPESPNEIMACVW